MYTSQQSLPRQGMDKIPLILFELISTNSKFQTKPKCSVILHHYPKMWCMVRSFVLSSVKLWCLTLSWRFLSSQYHAEIILYLLTASLYNPLCCQIGTHFLIMVPNIGTHFLIMETVKFLSNFLLYIHNAWHKILQIDLQTLIRHFHHI